MVEADCVDTVHSFWDLLQFNKPSFLHGLQELGHLVKTWVWITIQLQGNNEKKKTSKTLFKIYQGLLVLHFSKNASSIQENKFQRSEWESSRLRNIAALSTFLWDDFLMSTDLPSGLRQKKFEIHQVHWNGGERRGNWVLAGKHRSVNRI